MSDIKSERLSRPATSTNMLSDVIGWLRLGDCVILHVNNECGRVYHTCKFEDINEIRVISLNMANTIELMREGEWPWYIEHYVPKADCTCGVKEHLDNKGETPHIYAYSTPNNSRIVCI